MALLQAKGLLQEGQVLGNAALPSFEKWSMTAPRYLQYLANLLHVHTALERATAAALTEGLASHSGASLLLFTEHHMAASGTAKGLNRALGITARMHQLTSSIVKRARSC